MINVSSSLQAFNSAGKPELTRCAHCNAWINPKYGADSPSEHHGQAVQRMTLGHLGITTTSVISAITRKVFVAGLESWAVRQATERTSAQ